MLIAGGVLGAITLLNLSALILDGGVLYFEYFIGTLAATVLLIVYGLKVRKWNRWPVMVGTLLTILGAISATLALTVPLATKSLGARATGSQSALLALLLVIYAAALLGSGIPLIVWQKRHGGMRKLRQKRKEPAKIAPQDKEINTFYRPD
jgi:hypothetical protein